MTRSKSSGDLGTRTDRAKLQIRKEPSWLVLEKGRALGYAKGANGGTWIARYYNPVAHPIRAKKALCAADDVSDADGKMVLDWKQAQEAAREWFKTAFFQATGERVRTGVYTVAHAVCHGSGCERACSTPQFRGAWTVMHARLTGTRPLNC